MKKISDNLAPVKSLAASVPLRCNVVVEPSSIDFLNEGSVFASNSAGDCSLISPMPAPKTGRRRPVLGER